MSVKGKIAWRFMAEKIHAGTFKGLVQAIVAHSLEEYGDPVKVNALLKKLGRLSGEYIYTTYLAATKRPAKNLRDLIPTYNLGFKYFTGKEFDEIIFEERDKDVYITYRISDCPLCKGLHSPYPAIFMCNVLAGILEWIEEQRLEDWNAESVTCDETKYRARGDPYCGVQFHFKLK
ncbi:MAG: hypothetical protein ACTSYM_07110 [Candidatus Baldrarchaeia archaeon]